ncbi:XRE family transcriptional regulator [Methylobacterium isbiliense]|nr:XRE family transcriptional regulator [Methylobacterium isbiliense]MDN3622570.1 XRE family transcriptional regulator [Methylobacterium isbiliense]
MDVPEIIRALIRQNGGKQGPVAKLLGVAQPTVSRWQSGIAKPDFYQSQKLRAVAIEAGLLTIPEHELATSRTAKIAGFVGLGEEIDWMGEADVALEEVELPFPVPEGCVALEAKGDSMHPRVKNGEVVVIRPNGYTAKDLIGQEVVLKVREGPYLLKTLRRGTEPDLFNLESHNAPLREDVEVEWVAEVWAIIPSRRWRRMA